MSAYNAIQYDVGLAARLVHISSGLAFRNVAPFSEHQCVPVTLSGPLPYRDGVHTVTISLERLFFSSARAGLPMSPVVVRVVWKVSFGPAYPTEPCTWQLEESGVNNNNTRGGGGGDDRTFFQVFKLRPFLLAEVVSRITAQNKTDIFLYNCDATGNKKGGSRVIDKDYENDKTSNSQAINNGNSSTQNGTGTAVSSFISNFTFLYSWWAALELDEGCILPQHNSMPANNSFFGSMANLDECNIADYTHKGLSTCSSFYADENRVQGPKRKYGAVFMPQGEVLLWGVQQLLESDKRYENRTQGLLIELGKPYKNHGAFQNGRCYLQSTRYVLSVTSVKSDGSEHCPLAPLLVSSNILQSDVYQLIDICLYAEDPCMALLTNARICQKGKTLRRVSNAFCMLRHLIKGVSPHAPSTYMLQLLAPALDGVVKVMQEQRKPLWAGVMACDILLPSILNKKPLLTDIAQYLIDPVEVFRCVSLVSVVFSVLGFTNKFCEAELAKNAIVDAYYSKRSLSFSNNKNNNNRNNNNNNKDGSSAFSVSQTSIVKPYISADESFSLFYNSPINECAVCGLSLCETVRELDNNFVHLSDLVTNNNNGGKEGSDGVLLSSANSDERIVLQCVRCGHGGHLMHIRAWWKDKSVHTCPKGCNCLCIY